MLSCLTAFPSPEALLLERRCPGTQASHPRVWLPSRCVFQLPSSGGPLSTLNALRLRLSELFSSGVIAGRFSLPASSALAFIRQTLASLTNALQRLSPTLEAGSLLATRLFRPDR